MMYIQTSILYCSDYVTMSVNPAKIQKDLAKFVASSKLDNPVELKNALDKSMQALTVLLDKKDVKDRQNR